MAGLIFMCGEEPKIVADIFGMSIDSAIHIINLFLMELDNSNHPHLLIDLLPESKVELKLMTKEWQIQSHIYIYDLLWHDRCN